MKDLQTIIKIFETKQVRTIWNKEEEKYYISVIDIISVLTNNDYQVSRNYWKITKKRLLEEGNETVTKCNQLKLLAPDGKMRLTDVVDIEGMFRLIESIPSKKAEPIKLWLAHLGKERIDEEYDPEITINRALETYKRKGYSDGWIEQRLKSIEIRNTFTNELKRNGIDGNKEYANLTDMLTSIWSSLKVKEYKGFKGLTKESLRDNMTNTELVLNELAEVAATEISKSSKVKNRENAINSIIQGGTIAKNAREQLEAKTGKPVVSPCQIEP